jgi:hypothetical protein
VSEKQIGLNTGTPGFDVEGKTYAYDTVEKGEEGVEPIPTEKGDMNVSLASRDLSPTTKKTLADYLGKRTRGNYYPLDATTAETSISSPLKPTENSKKFIDRDLLVDKRKLQTDPREELVGSFEPGSRDNTKVNGNDLLSSKPTVVDRYVSAVLKNNRFTPSRQMVGDINDVSKNYDPDFRLPSGEVVSSRQLSQVGSTLSLRSSQELGATQSGFKPGSNGATAGALLPSTLQLGATKIESGLLTARDVLAELSDDKTPEVSYVSVGEKSWGSLNNIHEKFTGFDAVGMIGLSVALTSAVVLAFEGLSSLIGLVSPAPPHVRDLSGRYILGASSLEKNSNPTATSGFGGVNFSQGNFVPGLLGIRPTVKPFSACLKKGIEVYFGIDTSVLNAVKRSAQHPGHSVVVARMIVRSATATIESIKNVAASSSVVSGAENVLGLIDTIRTSKLIAAMNVFAQLGDQSLTENDELNVDGLPGETLKKSSIDVIDDSVPNSAAMKSRMTGGHTKLAWASNTTPSLYLLPTRLLGLSIANKLGGFQTGYGLQEHRTRSKYKLLETSDSTAMANRIAYSGVVDELTVKKIEAELEADYMPFYFHDLRTNEIIAFHAFLSSLSETYRPTFEQTEGFGRVDPVKIYKNTQRSISLKFNVVATSEDDFNDMWVKINKLVTLVYPQYTQGRSLSTDGYEFVQPFSQLMGASPMIRLRLGDLFKTNYSRFALARLFGAGTKETLKLNNSIVDFNVIEDKIEKKVNELKRTEKNNWYVASDGISIDKLSLSMPAYGSVSKNFASTFQVGSDVAYLPVTLGEFLDNEDAVIVIPRVISEKDLMTHYGYDSSSAAAKVKHLNSLYNNPKSPKTYVIGAKYKVPVSALRMTPMLSKTLLDQLADVVVDDKISLEALHEFMKPENNALAKSFESVRGKGLAGFIDSLDFDWSDKVTWEITPGSKAPQMCSISMTYSPIHDIAPGLDHAGMNRAPIYPVGFYNNRSDDEK